LIIDQNSVSFMNVPLNSECGLVYGV